METHTEKLPYSFQSEGLLDKKFLEGTNSSQKRLQSI